MSQSLFSQYREFTSSVGALAPEDFPSLWHSVSHRYDCTVGALFVNSSYEFESSAWFRCMFAVFPISEDVVDEDGNFVSKGPNRSFSLMKHLEISENQASWIPNLPISCYPRWANDPIVPRYWLSYRPVDNDNVPDGWQSTFRAICAGYYSDLRRQFLDSDHAPPEAPPLASVADPVSASQSVPSAVPQDDDDLNLAGLVDFSTIQSSGMGALKAAVDRYGMDAVVQVIHTKFGVAEAKKLAAGMPSASFEQAYVFLAANSVTPADARAFYQSSCSLDMQALSSNPLSDLNIETAVTVGDVITTGKAIYGFHGALLDRSRFGSDSPLLGTMAKISGLVGAHKSLVGSPIFHMSGGACTVSVFVAIMQKALRAVGVFQLFDFCIELQQGKAVEKVVPKNVVVEKLEVTEKYKASPATAQASSLITKLENRPLSGYVCIVGTDGTRMGPWQLFVSLCGHRAAERFPFHAALQRNRMFREHTYMNGHTKNAYALMKIADASWINYDPSYARMFHILADIKAADIKVAVIQVLSGFDVTILTYIRQVTDLEIFWFFTGSDDTLPSLWRPLLTCVDGGELVRSDTIDRLMKNVTRDGSIVPYAFVWLDNPGDDNVYTPQPNAKKTENSLFVHLSSNASIVYQLTSFAIARTFLVKSAGSYLLGDVPLPYDGYITSTDKLVPLKGKFVPIGHAPHTTQRIYRYVPGTFERAVGGQSSDHSIDIYQVAETLAMSQGRLNLLPSYDSPAIVSLGMRALRVQAKAAAVNDW